jgi:restriction endonuclease S subunit
MSNLVAYDWVESSIRELEELGIIQLGRGKIISQKDIDADPGEYPVYSSSARGSGEFGRYGKYMFDEELVTWSVDGGGKFFYRSKGRYSITNVSGFLRVKDKEVIDTYYAWAHLYSLWQAMTFNYTEKLHPSVLRDRFKFSYPSLPHQKAIGNILKAVQRAIEAQESIIQTSTELKQALMQKLFSEGLRGEPQKETEIGLVPESWEVVECGDACETISVGIVVQPSSYYVKEGVPAFRSQNVRADRIQVEPMVYISKEANDGAVRKSKLSAGDVLIVRTGYPGTSCVVPPEFEGSNCIDLIFARPDKSRLSSHYLSRFFNSDLAKRQVQAGKTGLAQQHYNVAAVKSTKIPLPSLGQQENVVTHLQRVDSKLDAAASRLNVLHELFRSLLHNLITDSIRACSMSHRIQP